jgi:hypothetical protein
MATATDVQQVPEDELEGTEGWRRLTDEPDIRGVEAVRHDDDTPAQWYVTVWVMEFVDEEPLEKELRDAIAAALRAVPGVTDVDEEDREVWAVEGPDSGEAVVRAVAAVVDRFAERTREHVDGLGP